jgi:hypothetical protein
VITLLVGLGIHPLSSLDPSKLPFPFCTSIEISETFVEIDYYTYFESSQVQATNGSTGSIINL